MQLSVDLNADMGESFGSWVMGDDESLLSVISSANIACGFHAGDPSVMARTVQMAKTHGVAVGAHPGFPDLQGFGRRPMQMAKEDLQNAIRYQFGALQGIAAAQNVPVRHLKLHGALANMCAEDFDLAKSAYEAALSVDPEVMIFVLSGTAQQRAAEELGAKWAGEIFADRAYNADATLVDRRLPGAVIHDPDHAAARIVGMVRAGAIIPEDGAPIPTRIDTICLHGDTPTAINIAQAVRRALEQDGITISPAKL